MSSIYDWSTTASDNATADASINWAEGMAPSGVNNSARVMMQRVAELLKDLGGVTSAGGSANALTLTASNAFTAYEDGLIVTLKATAANTDETTLNVNLIGTKPIVKMSTSGEAVLSGGEIQASGIYEFIYSSDLNGSAGAWLLMNPSAPTIDLVAPGTIDAFGGTTAPDGYLACDGTAVSRTTYARLFVAIGTTWGAGDGSTTFNLPDLEDEFLRGSGSARNVGTAQTDALKSHLHAKGTLATSSAGSHDHSISMRNDAQDGGADNTRASGGNTNGFTLTTRSPIAADGDHTHTITGSTASAGDTETRPQNKAVLWVIKY